MASRKRRPSGPTQPETERKARQRLLRLLPAVHRELDRLAARRGLTASGYVSALVMADASGLTDWARALGPLLPLSCAAPPTDASGGVEW